MIGVDVTTTASGSTPSGFPPDAASYFVPVLAERGPVDGPRVCTSLAQVERVYGQNVTYSWLHEEARAYFTEADGAGRMVIQRVVGPGAIAAKVTFNDRTTGSGAPTVRVVAASPGAWASNVSVEVVDGLLANTVDLHVYYTGQTEPVESYTGIPTVTALVQAVQASDYIRAVDLGSTAGTDALKLPRAVTATPLDNTGADDRSNVTAGTLVAALSLFTADMGPGIVSIPGQLYSTVGSALAAHCLANSRTAIVIAAQGTGISAAASAARSLRAITGSECLMFAYPWVQAPDGAGGFSTTPPTGFVAGRRASTIAATGPWDAPAGDRGQAKYIIGTDINLSADDVNTLDEDAVSPIRMTNSGPKLYSYRSLSADLVNWQFLTYRDTMNLISWQLDQALETYVNVTIDGLGHAYARIAATCEGVLSPIADAGGVYARRDQVTREPLDPGYTVVVDDDSLNPASQVQLGRINVYVGVRLSPLAKDINVTLAKVTLTTSL